MLPDVPGVLAGGALPGGGRGPEVGGDFDDCFPTSGGDWALVIGDVCGKGAEAAAVTALARYTVRASATLHSDRPEVVLQDLNDAIRREGKAAQPFLHRALHRAPAHWARGVSAWCRRGRPPVAAADARRWEGRDGGPARHPAGHPAGP